MIFTKPIDISKIGAGLFILLVAIVCLLIGKDIKNETSKIYLISLFYALVAVTALIVTLVK
jgi:hypothetical protein